MTEFKIMMTLHSGTLRKLCGTSLHIPCPQRNLTTQEDMLHLRYVH